MKQYIGTKIIEAEPFDEGYRVKYPDGYTSWLPKAAFENAYHSLDGGLSFSHALELLKAGKRMRRAGWNGRGIFIEVQRPDEHSKMTAPYIYINTAGLQTNNPQAPKCVVPWLASQSDMLAEDWEVS